MDSHTTSDAHPDTTTTTTASTASAEGLDLQHDIPFDIWTVIMVLVAESHPNHVTSMIKACKLFRTIAYQSAEVWDEVARHYGIKLRSNKSMKLAKRKRQEVQRQLEKLSNASLMECTVLLDVEERLKATRATAASTVTAATSMVRFSLSTHVDSNRIYTCGVNCSVSAWHLKELDDYSRPKWTFAVDHGTPLNVACNGTYVATVSPQSLYVLAASTGKCRLHIKKLSGYPSFKRCSLYNDVCYTANGTEILGWKCPSAEVVYGASDVETDAEPVSFYTHDHSDRTITQVLVDVHSQQLFYASDDIHLLDLNTNKHVESSRWRWDHHDLVMSLSESLLCVAQPTQLCVWDRRRSLQKPPVMHYRDQELNYVQAVAFNHFKICVAASAPVLFDLRVPLLRGDRQPSNAAVWMRSDEVVDDVVPYENDFLLTSGTSLEKYKLI